MVSIPDLMYSMIFLAFLIWFHFYSKRITRDSEFNNSLPS